MGMRDPYKLVAAASAAMLVCLFVWACGGASGSADDAGDDSQSTTLAKVGAASASDAMTADAMPLGVGTSLEFDANTPGRPVEVSFNLEGPWDFSSGPTVETLTMSVVEKSSAYSDEKFESASVAVYSYWSPGPEFREYNFQSRDDGAWVSYGKSSQEGRFVTYSNPSRALVFPVAVGNRWTESYSEVEDGKTVDIAAENTIVGRNQLRLPAGTFDAYLMQTKVAATRGGTTNTTWDYTWFVPGIGRAAEIISQPNEAKQPFTQAVAFYRLKSYKVR